MTCALVCDETLDMKQGCFVEEWNPGTSIDLYIGVFSRFKIYVSLISLSGSISSIERILLKAQKVTLILIV